MFSKYDHELLPIIFNYIYSDSNDSSTEDVIEFINTYHDKAYAKCDKEFIITFIQNEITIKQRQHILTTLERISDII